MMKNIKIFVFDVGNTLIETKRGPFISKQVLEDLYTLRKKGFYLGLSTLRTEEMIAPILGIFKFDFLILMNGGLIKIGDSVLFSCPLEGSVVSRIKKQASECGTEVIDYCYDGAIYALELPSAKDRFNVSDEYQSYIWEKSGNIDITPKGITKVHGLNFVCRQLAVQPSEIVAFGDGYNDIDMLKTAGISVAMGGAPDEVCEVATITTSTAGEDGVSVALRELEII